MEEQKVAEKTIPVFTVLKNGAILKNIFVVNSRDFSSPERNANDVFDDGEVEQIVRVGRHPDCDILLTHPSISRLHLEIRSIPSRHRLFVTDLSSVHGTWVADQKVEPGACVEVKEGDVIRIGGSTRTYRLHWIPLSRAYDMDSPFVSPLDASAAINLEEENRMLDAQILEIATKSHGEAASGDDGDSHLDVMSEGTGSSVPSEDGDTYITAQDILLPLASPSILALATVTVKTVKLEFGEDMQASSKWDLDVVDVAGENPSSGYSPSKQQSGAYPEVFGCSEFEVSVDANECDAREDGALNLDVLSERSGASVSREDEGTYITKEETSSPLASPCAALARDSVKPQKLHFHEDLHTSSKWDFDVINVSAEKPSTSFSLSKQQDLLGCSELEVAVDADECDVREDGPLSLDVMSERLESSVPSEDEDLYLEANEASSIPLLRDSPETEKLQLPEDVQASQELAINIIEANAENPVSCCFPSKGQIAGCIEALGCSAFELATEVEILSLHREVNGKTEFVIKQVMEASAKPQTTDVMQSHEDNGKTDVSRQVIAVSPNSFPQTQPSLEKLTEDSQGHLGSEFQSEVALETESNNLYQISNGETKVAVVQSHEDNIEAEVSRKFFAESPNPFPQTELTFENVTESSPNHLGSEYQSEVAAETDSENLYQKSNGETKVGSRQASEVFDCLFAVNKSLSRSNTEDIQSLFSSWQPLPESEVGAPSEIWSEMKPENNENQKSGMSRETENDGSSSYLSEDLKQSDTVLLTPIQNPKPETSIGSERSEESCSLSEIRGGGNAVEGILFTSSLAAETFEYTKPNEELPSAYTVSQENQTPQADAVRDDVLSEVNSSRSSSRQLSTCNIWSRRGKEASILQIRTNRSKGKQKQIGNQPKAQFQRKQALRGDSISLTVPHGGENLEPEIFTPDKENLTPRSHMLRRLQDISDIKDSKSSSKLSRNSCSSKIPSVIGIITSEALTEPEIFTPDKENLTPNSHMLKRLRDVGEIKDTKGSSSLKATRKPFFDIHLEENVMAEQKPGLNCMSSESKVKHEAVSLKNKVERTPFQPLLEKSSAQSQLYTEASSTASARNSISRGICSSSNLSDGENKMKWTIVVDTSSLMDKESRKPLHLLQGLKGTHLVVPRTVLREINEMKRSRSVFFNRKAENASSALDWIEECEVNTKWWIQLQTLSEETKATAPTPPVSPQSNGSAAFPFSLDWNKYAAEIDTPTSQDQVLECALLYRKTNSYEKLVVLSNDASLKIKAMAEGVICETAHEYYKSLVDPYSERFMWRESSARGRTWSQLDDVVLRERYNSRRGERCVAAKGLKLILLHNSRYGHNH